LHARKKGEFQGRLAIWDLISLAWHVNHFLAVAIYFMTIYEKVKKMKYTIIYFE